MKQKMTTEEFIKRCNIVHNNFYDYSKTIYINGKTNVTIIDPEYGEFEQRALRHLSGSQHPLRSRVNKRLSTNEFIDRCNKIHDNFFDYSKLEYKGMKQKIIVIDPDYGEFECFAENHMNGSGHPRRSFDKNMLSQDEFINRCKEVHNNLYDYSKVEYEGSNKKIIVVDPEYGEFEQRAGNHLSGQGHPNRFFDKLKLSLDEFIDKSNSVHNNFFDYSKVIYVNCYTHVTIIDPEYGEFSITPSYHMIGGIHPKRLYQNEFEIDHIIPLSFLCKSSERNKFKDDTIFKLMDSDFNKKYIPKEKNRNKTDKFILFGEELLARNYRNDYELLKYLFLRTYNLKINEYCLI